MSTPLRALLVEDSEDDALLLTNDLREAGYDLQWRRVDTARDLADALDAQQWDIIFGDYAMPQFTGVEALTQIRQRGIDTPFIFVSGSIGEDTAVAAMKAGAQDYVMKGNRKRLVPAIARELREAEMHRERRRAEEQLRLLETATHAAANAVDVIAALTATLDMVCEATGWTLAQAWLPREDRAGIECSPSWCYREAGLERFRTESLRVVYGIGEDLPGRAWASKRPEWIEDLTQHRSFLRAPFAVASGLRSAMVVPVTVADDVVAVLEFFAREVRPTDGRLVSVVSAVAAQLGGVMQRKRAEERLHYLAHYDALTGLPNRVLFVDRLKQATVEAARHRRLVGVMFLDLDRFKTINESLGHSVGDQFLKSVAARLRAAVREGDTVARLAGDEFTIVMPDMAHAEDAARLARTILESLAQPVSIGGHDLFASASLGMTLFPLDGHGIEGLLRNADIAMYRAKASGGNTYAFYSADMTAMAEERLRLETALRVALDAGALRLHYQPVVGLGSGATVGVEALSRWPDVSRGFVSPAQFIPLAEETGLITRIGDWALRAACLEWRNSERPLRLAVNVSVRQLAHADFVDTVVRTLDETGFDARQLDLEITESVLMDNAEGCASAMRRLGDMGVHFSIDDFGTGYSSLSYLKQLPIGRLKIDQSFVRGIPHDPGDVAIVTAIISMAHSLGIQVIAEGVESEAQLDFLRSHGCDEAQGFFLGKPLPPDKVASQLASSLPFRLS
jgi:diguanylate cyclase (GGDEF)-like protein